VATVWISSSNGLVHLEPRAYAREADLQEFIADHPSVLASAVHPQDHEPRWLLIAQELSIIVDDGLEKVHWSLDHLFVDGHGTPTLVEVKRSSDPRSRREVVGQMLDYAASFKATWSATKLRELWHSKCLDAESAMERFLAASAVEDADAFWTLVDTKIRAGEMRLLFVADRLSTPVVRIIEYLNEQMATTEVIGVEVLPHSSAADPSIVAYVPTVRGRTSAVAPAKSSSETRPVEEFERMLLDRHGPEVFDAVQQLIGRASDLGGFVTTGTDARNPRLFLNFFTGATGKNLWPLVVNPRIGKVALQLRWMAYVPGFDDEDRRAEFVSRCATAIGQSIDAPRMDGFPGFQVQVLTNPGVVDSLGEVLKWFLATAVEAVGSSRGLGDAT
jgi:hypothetical protein